MYKAKQDQLMQETNQGLIHIRQTEINYYVNVNATFGTQAALIGGFTYGTFLRDIETYRWWSHHTQTCYYIMASVTVVSAIIVIVLTMLVHVMAPGKNPPTISNMAVLQHQPFQIKAWLSMVPLVRWPAPPRA